MYKAVFILVLSLTACSHAARILAYFPVPSISHQVAFRPLVLELAKRGHEVVTITTDAAYPKGKAPENITEIDLHDISYADWMKSFVSTDVPKGDRRAWMSNIENAFEVSVVLLEKQLTFEEVNKAIHEKYDLVLIEACMHGALGLSHLHKVPIVQISSFGPIEFNVWSVGAPIHIFRQPTSLQHRATPLNLYEKMHELYMFYKLHTVYNSIEKKSDAVLKKVFGPDIPDISELKNNVDLLLLNVHPLWELNRPVPPNVIYMGGVHQSHSEDIPQDLKSYLDSSKNGVIYVSFGTNVDPSLLPEDRIQTLVKVFSALPYDVLWKWSKDELPGRTANIRISKWFPQSNILKHPKVKLFITQGGLQSTDEAITAGVPLLGIPMIGDQWYNTELYVYHQIGMRVDLPTLTEEILTDAINTTIKDDSYRQNIVKLRAILRDEVQQPLERAVWWIEYVLRHGGAKHLRSPLANLSWREYLEIDLLLVLATISILILIFSVFVVYRLYRAVIRLCCTKSKLKRT